MEAIKLQLANQTLLNPSAPQWDRAPVVNVALSGTEAQAQPSAYIRTTWAGRHIGAVRALQLRAAHNRQNIFFRLEWTDETHNPHYGDGSVFPDAAAVLFSDGSAPVSNMGSKGTPIDAWYWRANHHESGEALTFEGLASERVQPSPPVTTNGTWQDGTWSVVIGAPLEAAGDNIAFAVWEGSNQERAGLHSYSPDWERLEIR
jgi:DMSO reductase family type II enzyme heme b subunit